VCSLATIALAACGSSAGRRPTLATNTTVRSTAVSVSRVPAPLIAASAGNYYFTYSNLKPYSDVTIAAVVVTNRGHDPISFLSTTPVALRNLRFVGGRIADAHLVSPGTYRAFPPRGLDGRALPLYEPRAFRALRSGDSALLLLGLSLAGTTPGTISGVEVIYRAGGHQYRAKFREVTLLCPGNANSRGDCATALADARAVKD